MNKNRAYQSKKYSQWKVFSSQFLNLSKLACEKAENKINTNNGVELFPYIAVVYNIKHAIEICIKTYIRYLDEEVSFGGNLGHDIKILFDYLNKKDDIEKISNVINKLSDDAELRFVKEHIGDFKKIIKKTRQIVLKYYDLKKLNNKINLSMKTAIDYNNTFFKYPENNINCSFSYNKLLAEISGDDILEITDDIRIMEGNLFILGEILYYYRKYKK